MFEINWFWFTVICGCFFVGGGLLGLFAAALCAASRCGECEIERERNADLQEGER